MANRKEKKIAQKKSLADEYQKYLSSHGYKKDTLTFYQWKKRKKGETVRTKDIKKGVKRSGFDWEKDKPSARLKRGK